MSVKIGTVQIFTLHVKINFGIMWDYQTDVDDNNNNYDNKQ